MGPWSWVEDTGFKVKGLDLRCWVEALGFRVLGSTVLG